MCAKVSVVCFRAGGLGQKMLGGVRWTTVAPCFSRYSFCVALAVLSFVDTRAIVIPWKTCVIVAVVAVGTLLELRKMRKSPILARF
jgi:hypothetical protein